MNQRLSSGRDSLFDKINGFAVGMQILVIWHLGVGVCGLIASLLVPIYIGFSWLSFSIVLGGLVLSLFVYFSGYELLRGKSWAWAVSFFLYALVCLGSLHRTISMILDWNHLLLLAERGDHRPLGNLFFQGSLSVFFVFLFIQLLLHRRRFIRSNSAAEFSE